MFSRAEAKGIRVLDFFPHEEYIELHVQIPAEEGIIRDTVAIERMENGRITKLGNPVKYWAHGELKEKHFVVDGIDWLELDEKSPHRAERYGKIMNALNALVG